MSELAKILQAKRVSLAAATPDQKIAIVTTLFEELGFVTYFSTLDDAIIEWCMDPFHCGANYMRERFRILDADRMERLLSRYFSHLID